MIKGGVVKVADTLHKEEKELKEAKKGFENFVNFLKTIIFYPIDSLKKTNKRNKFWAVVQLILLVIVGIGIGYIYINMFGVKDYFTSYKGKVIAINKIPVGANYFKYTAILQDDKNRQREIPLSDELVNIVRVGDTIKKPMFTTIYLKEGQKVSFSAYILDFIFFILGILVFLILLLASLSFVTIVFETFNEEDKAKKKKRKKTKSKK